MYKKFAPNAEVFFIFPAFYFLINKSLFLFQEKVRLAKRGEEVVWLAKRGDSGGMANKRGRDMASKKGDINNRPFLIIQNQHYKVIVKVCI